MHKQWGAVDYLKSLTDITGRQAGSNAIWSQTVSKYLSRFTRIHPYHHKLRDVIQKLVQILR